MTYEMGWYKMINWINQILCYKNFNWEIQRIKQFINGVEAEKMPWEKSRLKSRVGSGRRDGVKHNMRKQKL